MDVLKILEGSIESLYIEDLEFLEAELDTGDYPEEYLAKCRTRLLHLRKWFNGEIDLSGEQAEQAEKTTSSVYKPLSDIAPGELNPNLIGKTATELFKLDVEHIRQFDKYKSEFKKFVSAHSLVDEDFVDKNFGFFETWEIGAIISVKQMSEEFLEKYFGAIDLDKVSRYQQFSEQFFMKHFSQLNVEVVLKRGKNEWRKKENRSTQLDVFLRLKGVKI